MIFTASSPASIKGERVISTVAYRDGVLAADTATTVGGNIMRRDLPKIVAHGDCLAGATGGAPYCDKFLKWVQDGCSGEPPEAKRDNDGSDHGLLIKGGEQWHHTPEGVFRSDVEYLAIGSGSTLAIGAMHAGATAPQAVRAGIEHDPYSGGDVTVLRLGA